MEGVGSGGDCPPEFDERVLLGEIQVVQLLDTLQDCEDVSGLALGDVDQRVLALGERGRADRTMVRIDARPTVEVAFFQVWADMAGAVRDRAVVDIGIQDMRGIERQAVDSDPGVGFAAVFGDGSGSLPKPAGVGVIESDLVPSWGQASRDEIFDVMVEDEGMDCRILFLELHFQFPF